MQKKSSFAPRRGVKIGLLLLIPAVVILGSVAFQGRRYAFVSLAAAVLICGAFILSFEQKEAGARKMILTAVMTALCVCGRFVFAPLPGVKPVTALVVITGMFLGGEAGFLTGALTALISNMSFGQGPWTPFQMLAWGLCGLAAGWLSRPLKSSRMLLLSYGALAGVVFSLLMDLWSVLWQTGGFNAALFVALTVTALPTTLTYAVSNVLFLLVLGGPFGKKLERIQIKYGC